MVISYRQISPSISAIIERISLNNTTMIYYILHLWSGTNYVPIFYASLKNGTYYWNNRHGGRRPEIRRLSKSNSFHWILMNLGHNAWKYNTSFDNQPNHHKDSWNIDQISEIHSVIFLIFFSVRLCRFCVVIWFFHPRHNGHWPPT